MTKKIKNSTAFGIKVDEMYVMSSHSNVSRSNKKNTLFKVSMGYKWPGYGGYYDNFWKMI